MNMQTQNLAQAEAQDLSARRHESETGCYILKQAVTATVKGQTARQHIGYFEVIVPSVKRMIEEVSAAKVIGSDADGLPVYDSDYATWLQRAINALAKAEARNKLAPRSAEAKLGLTIPLTLAALVEPPAVAGSTVLAEIAELVRGWSSWLAESGKPAALHSTFSQLVRQPSLIGMQADKVKQVLSKWLVDFAGAAAEAGNLTAYQEAHLQKVLDAIEGKDEPSLDDLLADF